MKILDCRNQSDTILKSQLQRKQFITAAAASRQKKWLHITSCLTSKTVERALVSKDKLLSGQSSQEQQWKKVKPGEVVAEGLGILGELHCVSRPMGPDQVELFRNQVRSWIKYSPLTALVSPSVLFNTWTSSFTLASFSRPHTGHLQKLMGFSTFY